MAKLRQGNLVWNFVTAGHHVGNQAKMHGDRKLRCNFCAHLFQGNAGKAACHFTQAKYCKAAGMRVLAEIWNGTVYTFKPATARRVQRWMVDEGVRDTRAATGGQRQRMDEGERDDVQDALDEEEGLEGGVGEGGKADEGVGDPDLPGEEVVMTSRGVGRAGHAPRAPRPELERARREKRPVGEGDVEVRETAREKRARQTTIDEMYDKEKLAEFHDVWLQWIYAKGLAFNAFRDPEVTAGTGIPSQRGKVASMVSKVRSAFRHTGATILSDGRKSRSGKPLVNFLAGGANGALLYATVACDGSVRDTADIVYRRWRAIILSFPAKDVIGFCTDSTSNYTAAAHRFATNPDADIRRITWLPCSTHVCNWMLSDVGTRVAWVKETIICARALVRFIKLQGACLKGRRDALESMLPGDEWARIPWDRRLVSQAQWVQQQIRDDEFWRCVDCAIRVMSPIHQLLRRMDKRGMMMSIVYEWSQHLLELMRRVDVPADMVEPCVREVAVSNLHMLEPAHAAAHLLNPRRRSLRYYESLQTTTDDAHVVKECDRFLLTQTGGDPVGRLYRTVRDQIRHFHSWRGDWGDRQLSDAEADDCRGDRETERCAQWWYDHGRHHPELRTIAIRDVFGKRAVELRPWPEQTSDADADGDTSDNEWTDDNDAPVSGDATAKRVYFTYGGGPDGMTPHISVITDDVPSGGRRRRRPRADEHMEEQEPLRGLRQTGRRWEVRSDSEPEGAEEEEEVRLWDRRFSPSHHRSTGPPEPTRPRTRSASAAERQHTPATEHHEGTGLADIPEMGRTPSCAGVRHRLPSELRTDDFYVGGSGGGLGDLSAPRQGGASLSDVLLDDSDVRGHVETTEEWDARVNKEEEERLRTLSGWEGRFAYVEEQRRRRDLETGGGDGDGGDGVPTGVEGDGVAVGGGGEGGGEDEDEDEDEDEEGSDHGDDHGDEGGDHGDEGGDHDDDGDDGGDHGDDGGHGDDCGDFGDHGDDGSDDGSDGGGEREREGRLALALRDPSVLSLTRG
ncbi:hypothetical protein CBR_g48521 [Chara braunii]|uniref:DUF659 domain-containing protein n=1 Tax=Chara braunii TaxID=69332 RepID=A0A388M355_CHABU|nr:hypothetical protein CBR_g48521 [Chara braunii]|eukprot:GBG88909.1 hypothetical protein CBR_g48521 [Chara braunii]